MWKLDDTRIYVEKDSGWYCTPRKGTVELLDTEYSIIHTAGRPSYKRDLTFVVFSGYYTEILPKLSVDSVTLLETGGSTTSVSILEMRPERLYDYLGREIFRVDANLIEVD